RLRPRQGKVVMRRRLPLVPRWRRQGRQPAHDVTAHRPSKGATMRARFSILVAVTCSVVATTAATANGAREGRADVPACEELLSVRQAKEVLREPLADILTREVVGTTRNCDYIGGKKNAPVQRTLGITWGPWAELRKRAPSFAKSTVCPVSKSACQDMKKVATTRRDLDSFKYLEQALSKAGNVRRLRSPVFEGNPVLVW